MNLYKHLLEAGEYCAAGLYEEPERSLFYRKSLALRRFYETAPVPEYCGGQLYPSGGMPSGMAVNPHYMTGIAVNRSELSSKLPEAVSAIDTEFFRYTSTVPREHTVAGNMYTHSMPNYPRIAAEGFDSYLERVRSIADPDMREGLSHLIEGIRTYISRILAYLSEIGAPERLIAAFSQVPMKPARDIYEAIVCHNFLFFLDGCDNLGCVASDLMPYYRGEDVTDLLRELYDNCDRTGGYSMAIGSDYNPLTLQCLEAVKGKRRPMIELFIDEDCPDEVWNAALDAVRTNGGQPAFYNKKVIYEGLRNRFSQITETDIRRFCGGGCTEAMIEGLSNVGSLDAGINLPLILTEVMRTSLESSATFEEFYQSCIAAVSDVVDTVTREIANSQKSRAEHNPLPMRTLLIDDCIDRGTEYNSGGARYMWSIVNFAGMINLIDSLLVIEDYIYNEKKMTAAGLLSLLDESDEAFLSEVRRHPVCFGINNDRADALAKRVSEDIFALLDNKKPQFGFGFLPASIQFMTAAMAGKEVAATPDGRCAGAPLCESLGAISAKDVKGPTAMLSSVASLSLGRALGIPVVNLTVNSEFNNEILKSIIKGYLAMGGVQLQLTCTSKKMLEEAYADPEKHRNLVIRVGGYSEYFHRLSDDLKKLVLSRTIH